MLEFNLPKSTVYYIKNKFNIKNKNKNNTIDVYQDIFGLKLNQIHNINQLVKPPTTPLTIKSISERWNLFDNSNIKPQKLIIFLKEHLKYNFKKGSSTTHTGASPKIHTQQSIFSWRILSNILLNKYIVNIDESSF